eukprot:TCALIF_03030-PA protein Name:"Protein of unknown function" AED:0.10 eAED:0.10 QI:0/0/0.33/1/1/0.66/3/125/364
MMIHASSSSSSFLSTSTLHPSHLIATNCDEVEKSCLSRGALSDIHVPGQIHDFELSENENLLAETQDFKFIPGQRKLDGLQVTLAISKMPGDQILALSCNKKPLTQFQTSIDNPVLGQTNSDANDRIGKPVILVFDGFPPSAACQAIRNDDDFVDGITRDAKDVCHIVLQMTDFLDWDHDLVNSILIKGGPDLVDTNFHRVLMIDVRQESNSTSPSKTSPSPKWLLSQRLLQSRHLSLELRSALRGSLESQAQDQHSSPSSTPTGGCWQVTRDLLNFALWGPMTNVLFEYFPDELEGSTGVLNEDDLLKWLNVERAQMLQSILQTQGLRDVSLPSDEITRLRYLVGTTQAALKQALALLKSQIR